MTRVLDVPQLAQEILEQELADRVVDLDQAPAALRAAEESLLPYARVEWADPANPWEVLVVALAVAVLRLRRSRQVRQQAAVEAVRQALAGLAQGRAA